MYLSVQSVSVFYAIGRMLCLSQVLTVRGAVQTVPGTLRPGPPPHYAMSWDTARVGDTGSVTKLCDSNNRRIVSCQTNHVTL